MRKFDVSQLIWKRMREVADEIAAAELTGHSVAALEAEYTELERQFQREI
jgi:hypothetical protein